jgi:hypothetical protein
MIVVDSLLFAALFVPELITTETLTATFYFALFVHVMSTLYIGTFGRLRTATWLLLIGAWAGWEIGTFASLVRPWRQWQAWLTQWPLFGDALVASVGRWPYLALFLLALDVVVMHYADWRRRSFLHMVVFLAAVIGATVATDLAVSAMVSVPPLPPPAQEPALPALIPIWYALPVYALLRAAEQDLGRDCDVRRSARANDLAMDAGGCPAYRQNTLGMAPALHDARRDLDQPRISRRAAARRPCAGRGADIGHILLFLFFCAAVCSSLDGARVGPRHSIDRAIAVKSGPRARA